MSAASLPLEAELEVLEPGRNCWRIERAGRASLIVDAADYFRLARKAMLRAERQILLIGWDFDTRICLDYDADDGAPVELGKFLTWLPRHRPQVQIHILKWDVGTVYLLGRGTTLLRLARWARNKQIHFKLDGAHATGASHHHKIVVIDDALAFCGGIDMTGSRWDTRGHLDCDEHRHRPTTKRRYDPWHDSSMAVDGEAARALGELARNRWSIAGGGDLPRPQARSDPWPEELEPQFRNVEVAIARTRAEHGDQQSIREIEALYVDMIREAKRFVYFENQYFASRVIAEAMARRLTERQGPEFVVVNPKEGKAWLDDEVMSPARAEIVRQLRKCDHEGRFRIYSPVTEGGDDIYVHSKITIADDRQLRVGSANLNNRSMGLDSECDVMIDCEREANAGAQEIIAGLRSDLLAEHLGVSVDTIEAKFADTGSLIRTIEAFSSGQGRGLLPLPAREVNGVERALAHSELLDPESAGEPFEPMARPGLVGRLSRLSWRHPAAAP